MTNEFDLRDPVNRIDSVATDVMVAGQAVAFAACACAYPGGGDGLGSPYQVDDHQVVWSVAGAAGPLLEVTVRWQGVWISAGGEVYGCIESARVEATATEAVAGATTVTATFGTPVFTAANAGDGWAVWAATLPVVVRVADDAAVVAREWLLAAGGQAHDLG